jgi:hypothetical protein
MRRLQRTIGTMAVLLLGLGVAAAQAEPQFTGSWVLDRAQSQFPKHERQGQTQGQTAPDAQTQPQQPPQVTLTVAQQGNTLKVTRTIARGTRSHSMTDVIVADGSDQVQQGYRGNAVTRSVFEGDRLVVTHTHTKKTDQGEQTMSRQSVWTLSPDGRVLTIDTTMHSPRGDRSMKTVYQRS